MQCPGAQVFLCRSGSLYLQTHCRKTHTHARTHARTHAYTHTPHTRSHAPTHPHQRTHALSQGCCRRLARRCRRATARLHEEMQRMTTLRHQGRALTAAANSFARVVPRMRLKIIIDKNHFTPTKLYFIFVGQRISFSCLEGLYLISLIKEVLPDKLYQRIKK